MENSGGLWSGEEWCGWAEDGSPGLVCGTRCVEERDARVERKVLILWLYSAGFFG